MKNNMPDMNTPAGTFWWLFVSIAVIYGFALFNHGFVPSMEPRFAEVIKEMVRNGDYLIPVKNGRPYVEYPPLLYWLGAAGKQMGLPMQAAIRLPCYLGLLGWLAWMVRLQRLLAYDWPAYAFVLVGAASPGILFHFFTAQPDSLLILGVLIAYTGFVRFRQSGRIDNSIFWELWGGIALATAAKGPVGIVVTLPAMALEMLWAASLQTGLKQLLSFSGVRRLWHLFWPMAWFRGAGILLLVTVPWYIAAYFTEGWDFIRATVIYQNVYRFLYPGFAHNNPWWYFFPNILATMLPIGFFILFGLVRAFRERQHLQYRLPLVWGVFTFVFFSMSVSKQGKYILPAAPAFIALGFMGLRMVGDFFGKTPLVWKMLRGWSIGFIAFWGVLVIGVLPFLNERITDQSGFDTIRNTIAQAPGKIVHFQWPRSTTLYQLGDPMDFVRSSRELYDRIRNGDIRPGDYLLVRQFDLASGPNDTNPAHLILPSNGMLKEVLRVKAKNEMVLYRVAENARTLTAPATPEPPPVDWRHQLFDTD